LPQKVKRERSTYHFVIIPLDKGYSIMYIALTMIKQLKIADITEYFTVEEAANELGIKPTAIRNYLYEEKLTTYKFKTLTLVKREEVEEWRKRQK